MQILNDDKVNAEMLASRTGAELIELKEKYEALEEEVERLRALLAAKQEEEQEEAPKIAASSPKLAVLSLFLLYFNLY